MLVTIIGILLLLAGGFGIGIYVLNRKIKVLERCEPHVYAVAQAVGTVQADPDATDYARRFAAMMEAVVTDDQTYRKFVEFVHQSRMMPAGPVRRTTQQPVRRTTQQAERERKEALGAHAATLHNAVVALGHILAAKDPHVLFWRQSMPKELKDKRQETRRSFFDWFDSTGGGSLNGHATV